MKRRQIQKTLRELSNKTGIPIKISLNSKNIRLIQELNRITFAISFLNSLMNRAVAIREQRKALSWLNNIEVDAVPIKKKQRAFSIELMRSYPQYGGDVMKNIYKFKNEDKITKQQFLSVFSEIGKNARLTFPVITQDKRIEFKTIKYSNLYKVARNNFQFNTKSIGSDAGYQQDVVLDFSRPFSITTMIQKSDLKGTCNAQKTMTKKLRYCIVVDVYTKHKNCAFACLKYLNLAHDIPLKQQGGIKPEDLLSLCERNKIPLTIYLDEPDNNHLRVFGVVLTGENKIVFAMKNEQAHYYVFQDINRTKQEKQADFKEQYNVSRQQANKKWINVFYDLETIYDVHDDLFCQTYSCVYFDQYQEKFQTTLINENNIQSFKDDCVFLTGIDVCEQMVNRLIAKYDMNNFKFRFISFNGSNFDDYFLLQQALRYGEGIHATFQSKSVLGLTFKYGQCWDLRKFLTVGSLASLCDSFKVFPKKLEGFNHMDPQIAFENKELQNWVNENIVLLTDYNKLDVLSLYSLTQKFRNLMLGDNMGKTDVFDYNTIGQHSFSLCQEKWKENGLIDSLNAPKTEEDDLFIRKCLTAGRCQVMGSKNNSPIHMKGQSLSMVDVVSLYPYVMMSQDIYYPCGDYDSVSQRNKDKLGFYKVIVKQKDDLPNVLPRRDFEDPQMPLDWNDKTQFETYCSSIDIDVLLEHGHQVEVCEGLEFQQKISGQELFQSLLGFKNEKITQDVYKDHKKELYNQAMRETCKIYLNSLSGKVIQRNFDSLTKIVRSRRELHQFLDNCKDGSCSIVNAQPEFSIANGKKLESYTQKFAKPSYLGVYIYSHARKHMYNNVYTQFDTLYTDTDSALGLRTQEQRLRESRPWLFQLTEKVIDGQSYMIKDFGTLDSELKPEANECILLQPKCYFVGNRETGYLPKIKCKGVSFKSQSCKYVPDSYIQLQINAKEFRQMEITLKQKPFLLFDKLLENGEVKIACEQLIVKNLRGNNERFGVAVRHIIKTITIKNVQ